MTLSVEPIKSSFAENNKLLSEEELRVEEKDEGAGGMFVGYCGARGCGPL